MQRDSIHRKGEDMSRTYQIKQKNHASQYIFLLLTISFSFINGKKTELVKDYLNFEAALFDDSIQFYTAKPADSIAPEYTSKTTKQNKKSWTFIVYIAADNDLRIFAANNIKQMAQVGSNENLNIAVHLDIRITGNKKITRRYYVEKNKIVHVNANDPSTQRMDSGNPQTLVSCCKWAIENYPAENYALILWNHGTGVIDPGGRKVINPAELFTFNPRTQKLDLDRSVGFLDLIDYTEQEQRGICWDNTTGNYLTNHKLDEALKEICSSTLNGNKFSIIGFDACLMSMIEITTVVKKHAHIMVGSQEVELGTGWNYTRTLTPLLQANVNKATFAQHIVDTYGTTYSSITNDFTQSAINLDQIHLLEHNVHTVGHLLSECLKIQKNNRVKNAIRASRAKNACTHFDEPSYLDLHHLYRNIQARIREFAFTNEQIGTRLKNELRQALEEGKQLIKQQVLAINKGRNLKNAQRISIYLPERRIQGSYMHSQFAATNAWAKFVTLFLRS